MNRRLLLTNGKEWTIRRATPEPQDNMVKGIADAFDPEIGILRIDRTDGKPLAVLFTFADHNYTGVPNRGATAGFPGFASKVIEENLGIKVKHFAFPNGKEEDFNEELRDYCRDIGFESVTSVIPGTNNALKGDPMNLKRISATAPAWMLAGNLIILLLRDSLSKIRI